MGLVGEPVDPANLRVHVLVWWMWGDPVDQLVSSLSDVYVYYLVPVWPHAGGLALCEMVQHISLFDYICVSPTLENK